jgi:hypothetical protein
MDINNLLAAYNGAAVLQAGTAEWGFVEPEWYLALPEGHNLGGNHAHILNTTAFGPNLNATTFVKANYRRLFGVLQNADKALFIAMLRYHYAVTGFIDMDPGRRGVIENEYSNMAPLDNAWDHANNNIPEIPQFRNIANFVKRYADTLLQMMVYVFSSRGHHWQPSYDDLYERLLQANSIIKPNTWQFPTYRELFRQGLHCFGVRIPLEYTLYCKNNNRMGNPMNLRFTPHSPIAGAAQALTTQAILTEMSTETWWGSFNAKFLADINEIAVQVALIHQHPYEYHVAARTLTGNPKRDLRETFNPAFERLSQFCLGYLDHLGRRHALTHQQSVTHHCGGPKALADTFARACDRLGRPSIEGVTMVEFIQSL